MRKKIIYVILSVLLLLTLVGCNRTEDKNQYDIFYLNLEMTKLVSEKHTIEADAENPEAVVEELIELMKRSPDDSDLRKTIPENVNVISVSEESGIVINFSREYSDLSPTEEVLTRAAIVRTLGQVSNYAYVSFFVEGEPLAYKDGTLVGYMEASGFVENPGKQINTTLSTNLTLYFSDKTGGRLKEEIRTVHYSTNKSLEKVVLEELIAGPKNSESMLGTLPSGVNIVSVSVVDGICYVNFDDTIQNILNNSITEQVILYSIVDSLTSLSGVEKVQISINGETKGKFRYNYDLASLYEFDDSLIEKDSSEDTEAFDSGLTDLEDEITQVEEVLDN